jgi:hypothetical protein
MQDQQDRLPAVLIVSEPEMADFPHFNTHSAEVFAMNLSGFFDVSLLLLEYSRDVPEKFSTEVKTADNYTRIKVRMRYAGNRILRRFRTFIACKAGVKVFEKVSQKPVAVISYGLGALNILYKKHKFGNVLKFAVINRIPEIHRHKILKILDKKINSFLFFDNTVKDYFSALSLNANSDCEVVNIPVDADIFENTTSGTGNSFLFVIDEASDDLIAVVKREMSSMKNKTIFVSAEKSFFDGYAVGNLQKVKDFNDFKQKVSSSGYVVVAGDYYKMPILIASIVAVGKPVLFLTNHNLGNFPLKDYCEIMSREQWSESEGFVADFASRFTGRQDAYEFISDNFSPKVLAFAVKTKIESLQNTDNERDR